MDIGGCEKESGIMAVALLMEGEEHLHLRNAGVSCMMGGGERNPTYPIYAIRSVPGSVTGW